MKKSNFYNLKMRLFESEKGYSLTELLVVLVIIGILIMIAVPIYQNITTRAKMTEAKTMLKTVHTLQKTYHLEHDTYTKKLSQIGFEQSELVTNGGSARYKIEVEKANTKEFVATATSLIDFDGDEQYNVWEVDEEGQIKQRVTD